VETSVTMLAVLTLLFGTIELARLIIAYTTLANAAHSAVRYASVHEGTGASGVVTQLTSAAGMSSGSVTVTPGPTGTAVGQLVGVTLSYPFAPVVGFVHLTVTLSASAQSAICF
jgi:Flp pilus assembly protein TadG